MLRLDRFVAKRSEITVTTDYTDYNMEAGISKKINYSGAMKINKKTDQGITVVNIYTSLKYHFEYQNVNSKLFVTLFSESPHDVCFMSTTVCARSAGLTPDIIINYPLNFNTI